MPKYRIKTELKKDWYLLVLIAAVLIFGLLIAPALPEYMATHWNIHGEADGYSPRLSGILMLPLFALGIYLMMLVLPVIDPRRENYPNFIKVYRVFRIALVLFMLGLQLLSLGYNLGFPIQIDRIVILGLGLLFTIMGKFFPQIKHNYFVGIRTPWTLASEEVWVKTHQLGGKLFMGSGLIIILSFFLPARLRFWLTMVSLIGGSLITVVYSYLIYRRQNNQ
ncbi:MAG: SdpI family protein [Firmicutes bacterium]|nr:SdpI family protein [Bacillota bacterium]